MTCINVANGSSDPSDPEAANIYLGYYAFHGGPGLGAPQSSLHCHIHVFEANRFLHIDEVKDLQVQDLTKEPFSFLQGTMQFVSTEANRRVCSVDWAVWETKKGRLLEL